MKYYECNYLATMSLFRYELFVKIRLFFIFDLLKNGLNWNSKDGKIKRNISYEIYITQKYENKKFIKTIK